MKKIEIELPDIISARNTYDGKGNPAAVIELLGYEVLVRRGHQRDLDMLGGFIMGWLAHDLGEYLLAKYPYLAEEGWGRSIDVFGHDRGIPAERYDTVRLVPEPGPLGDGEAGDA